MNYSKLLGGLFALVAAVFFLTGCELDRSSLRGSQWWQRHDGAGNLGGGMGYSTDTPFKRFGPDYGTHHMHAATDLKGSHHAHPGTEGKAGAPAHYSYSADDRPGFHHYGEDQGMLHLHGTEKAPEYRERGDEVDEHFYVRHTPFRHHPGFFHDHGH